jgi:hypothetical protein
MVKEPKVYRNVTQVFTVTEPPAAFVSKSGSALAFVTLTDEYTLMIGKNYEFSWARGESTAFSPPTAKYQSAITSTTLHDVVLLIPPKGGGKIQLLSFESQLVDAGGY